MAQIGALLLGFLMAVCLLPVRGGDSFRERVLMDEILAAGAVGEPVWLGDGEARFLGLWNPAVTAESQGTVILLHDFGRHLDWPEVIRPLRLRLPRRGWSSLSIQMPLREAGAPPADYLSLLSESTKRVSLALGYLQEKQIRNIVLLGHGLGGVAAVSSVRPAGGQSIRGLILVSLPAPLEGDMEKQWLDDLDGVQIPLLDVVNSRPSAAERAWIERRRGLLRPKKSYQLLQLAGTGPDFGHAGGRLEKRIYGWLTRFAPGMEVRSP